MMNCWKNRIKSGIKSAKVSKSYDGKISTNCYSDKLPKKVLNVFVYK